MSKRKTCVVCGQNLPASAMRRNRRSPDGLDVVCTVCARLPDPARVRAEAVARRAEAAARRAEAAARRAARPRCDALGCERAAWKGYDLCGLHARRAQKGYHVARK